VRRPTAAKVLIAVLALAGCSGGEESVRPDELPVACVAKAQPGRCRGSIPKVYYDYRENRCKTFYWGGCGGFVPYQTMDECRQQCEGRH
jgi:hypothetical protein